MKLCDLTNDDQTNHAVTSPTNSEAVRSGDWVGELEAVLTRVGAVRDAVPAGCPEPTRDLLACAENDLRAVLRAERRRSPTDKAERLPAKTLGG